MKVIHALVFALIYLWEVVLSTWKLALTVLRPKLRINPRFIEVPLDLKQELPRFLFACLISMTPGTMSVGLDARRGILLVHVLDAPDPDAAVRDMKKTFEQPLIRIFGRG
jgi:multisubunit Na+/H+ antiporter MnhE subunit